MDYLSTVRVLDNDYKIKDEEAARINHKHKVEEIEGAAKEGHKHQASEIDGLSAFVQSAIAAASTGAAKYQGGMTAKTYQALTTYKQGWYWVVTEDGTIAGESCEVGDMVFCNTDKAATGTKKDSHFDIVQNNIDAIPLSVINALS